MLQLSKEACKCSMTSSIVLSPRNVNYTLIAAMKAWTGVKKVDSNRVKTLLSELEIGKATDPDNLGNTSSWTQLLEASAKRWPLYFKQFLTKNASRVKRTSSKYVGYSKTEIKNMLNSLDNSVYSVVYQKWWKDWFSTLSTPIPEKNSTTISLVAEIKDQQRCSFCFSCKNFSNSMTILPSDIWYLAVFYLDITKAFHTVPYTSILAKIRGFDKGSKFVETGV